MKRLRNIFKGLIIIAIALPTIQLKAQDARYAMPYANPFSINPAISGANTDIRLGISYRSQWDAIEKGFTSYAANLLYPIFTGKQNASENPQVNSVNGKLDIGAGAQLHSAGAFSSLNIDLAIGYTLKLAENHYLSTALTGSYIQKSLDATGLTFDDQYVLGQFSADNPSADLISSEKAAYPSAGAGITWFYNDPQNAKINAYIGAAAFNINKPNETFTGGTGSLPRRYSFQGGVKIRGENKIDLTPNIIYSFQNGAELLSCGIYSDFRFSDKSKLVLAAWYRFNDAASFLVGFDYEYFSLAYAYDLPSSSITKVITGLNAHNISVAFKLNQAKKRNLFLNNPVPAF